MIVVVADDISGAAEIAAVGNQYGLTTQVQTTFKPSASADLLAIDTDTRSLSKRQAQQRISHLAQQLCTIPVHWCFKKVDSVLRGHVGTELAQLMEGLGKQKTLLAPGNPSKGRTIRDGQYWINNQPLHLTDFAHDPEYPVQSSQITELLGNGSIPVLNLENDTGQSKGIVVCQAQSQSDLHQWAKRVSNDVLAAGAADFFTALLQTKLPKQAAAPQEPLLHLNQTELFVCGSGSETSRQTVKQAARLGFAISPMPAELAQGCLPYNKSLIQQWAEHIVARLIQNGRVIAAITEPVKLNAQLALDLRTRVAAMVKQVLSITDIPELFIEGGATARATFDALSWQTFDVKGSYSPGVVQLQVQTESKQLITLKPGSYPWPEPWFSGKKSGR